MKNRIALLAILSFVMLVGVGSLFAQENVVYNFDTEGDAEGWVDFNGTTIEGVSGGDLVVSTVGKYGGVYSASGLNLDEAVFTKVEIVMENTTSLDKFQFINFITDNTAAGDGAKVNFFTTPLTAEYETFTLDILPNPDASGLIDRIGIRSAGDPSADAGGIKIKSITLISNNPGGTFYDLTTNVVGYGSISPASGSFEEAAVKDVLATPSLGYKFDAWSGDVTGTDNPVSITMDSAIDITASFSRIEDFDFNWQFNTDGDNEDWKVVQGVDAAIAGGSYTMTLTSNTPKIKITDVGISAEDYGVIEVRLKNNTAVDGTVSGDCMRFAYQIEDGSDKYFNIDAAVGSTANDADFKVYQLRVGDKSTWSGIIEALTFVGPRNVAAGTVEIDYIKLLSRSAQSITFDALAAVTMADGPIELNASSDSQLDISYFSNDTTVAKVSGSTLTLFGTGTAIITAKQKGDAFFFAADSVNQDLVVTKGDQTITFAALDAKNEGDADFELTATASSGLDVSYVSSDGSVATVSGSTVTIVGPGSTNITASQAGDDSYNAAADVVQELVVNIVEAIHGFQLEQFVIYPNPVKETLFLNVSDIDGRYKILDTQARVIETSELTHSSIDVSHLKAGSYFFVLEQGNSHIVKEFLIVE